LAKKWIGSVVTKNSKLEKVVLDFEMLPYAHAVFEVMGRVRVGPLSCWI